MQNFAIATGHELTTNAAAEVLRAGGSAVDAAIAAAFMSCIAEPVLASPLAGGFLMVAPANSDAQCLDFFVQTPKLKRSLADIDLRDIEVDFGPTQQTFYCGAGTIATPGMVPGLFEAHAQFGRIPMPELVSAAVTAARSGVAITTFQAEVLGYVEPIFRASADARALYTINENLLAEGDILTNSRMADTLEVMALEGPRFFQEGEVAHALLSLDGGQLQADDLKSYRPIGRKVLRIDRRGVELDLNPSPSLGGVQIALCLKALPNDPDDRTLAKCLHEIANIRVKHDVDHHPELGENILLDPTIVEALRKTLQQHQASTRGTTHISIIDQQGMGASLTLSNGEGCGVIVPGTGIMANNMLGEDDLVPDGPNSWTEDRRLASMMCPMALRSGGDLTMLGSGGSNRIRSALAQVAVELIDREADLDAAISAPRAHVEPDTPQVLDFEDLGSDERRAGFLADFPNANAWPKKTMFFGGVHAVRRHADGGFEAVGDARRSGFALTE